MSRTVCLMMVIGLLGNLALAGEKRSNVIRPKKVNAKVKGCSVSEPGRYSAAPGDLIELEYTFPMHPDAIPEKVRRDTDKGAVYPSKLGIRNLIVPRLVGTGTYVFYFEVRDAGKGTAFVVIDRVKYEYHFDASRKHKINK